MYWEIVIRLSWYVRKWANDELKTALNAVEGVHRAVVMVSKTRSNKEVLVRIEFTSPEARANFEALDWQIAGIRRGELVQAGFIPDQQASLTPYWGQD